MSHRYSVAARWFSVPVPPARDAEIAIYLSHGAGFFDGTVIDASEGGYSYVNNLLSMSELILSRRPPSSK